MNSDLKIGLECC